jgi:alkylation response protein AidB-like acyl-CoA dehydrogenase
MLVAWLRGIGYERIGLAGTSLGVQVAALLATVDTSADRYLFDRPLADLVEPLQRRAPQESAEMRALLDALRDFYRPVSPFQRPSRVSSLAVDVVVGREDRVVGRKEAETLSRHFDVQARTYPCGHVLSLGRERLVVELMQKLGTK